jgi:two-component sensor histidine kinase
MAYLAIPFVLFGFVRRIKNLPFRPMFILFGLFIVACGFTHFMGYLMSVRAMYRLDGLVKFITAAVSWATVLALFPAIPRALAMRSPEDLEREVADRTRELEKANTALERERAEIQSLNASLTRAMSETHHRVKNNLQIVSAIVDLQAVQPGETVDKAELERIARHIRSLASIHDLLTHQAKRDSRLATLSLKATFEKLMPNLQSLAGDRNVIFSVEDIPLPVRYGTSLAIISSELIMNSFKHGDGVISLKLFSSSGRVTLEVTDRGMGFPEGFDPSTSASTGLELIESLTLFDLQGTTKYETLPGGGARATVDFPIPPVASGDQTTDRTSAHASIPATAAVF